MFKDTGEPVSIAGVFDSFAAWLMQVIVLDPVSSDVSPVTRVHVMLSCRNSSRGGTLGDGRGWPSPNATAGSRRPNERIHLPTAAKETRTSHEPPSYSDNGRKALGK